MNQCATSNLWRHVAGAAVLCATWLAGSARACDTPVYRYAMYRWLPAPYELYCFHDGPRDAGTQAILDAAERCATDESVPANLVALPVDVRDEKQLAGLRPEVREAWDTQSASQAPWCLLASPVGIHIFGGTMAAADVAALVDSPARREVGRLLEEGKAGVYVLLTGEDRAANEQAEQEIRGVIDDVAAGRIELYTLPATSAVEDAPRGPAIEFGLVNVARGDVHEQWFVDYLLALAPDLRAHAEPQVYLIYGRGRALFSSLGKGIHRDNLTMDVQYITGACSCLVKDENPGVDLLMSYDWDAVAESLAEQYGAEEGNPYSFSGGALFPELVIPLDEPSAPNAEMIAGAVTTAETLVPAESTTTATTATTTSATPAVDTVDDSIGEASGGVRASDARQAVEDTGPPGAVDPIGVDTTSPWRTLAWVGGGLLATLAALFGATFLVLWPR